MKAHLWKFGVLVLLPFTALAHDHRTDACGCHQQYGLRHCHPTKKTAACEAPVKAVRTVSRPAPVKKAL